MSTLIAVLASVALLAGIGAAIWLKVRQAGEWASLQEVQAKAQELEAREKAALQAQIEADREARQEELKHEADEILAENDPSVRQLRALELLAKLRGVH